MRPAAARRSLSPVAAASRPAKQFTWDHITARAPRMAATMGRYLDQLAVSARPGTVNAYGAALRFFSGHIPAFDPACTTVAAIEHRHVEEHKRWMAKRPGIHQAR